MDYKDWTTIAVDRLTWRDLVTLKISLGVDSMDDVIRYILDNQKVKGELPGPGNGPDASNSEEDEDET